MLVSLVGLLAIGGVSALYLSGLAFTGTLTATAGVQPAVTTFDWDVVDISGMDMKLIVWNNPDGDQEYSFTFTEDIVSTSPNCAYQEDLDLQFMTVVNTVPYPMVDGTTFTETLVSGDNVFEMIVIPHANRCPLSGNISFVGTLV